MLHKCKPDLGGGSPKQGALGTLRLWLNGWRSPLSGWRVGVRARVTGWGASRDLGCRELLSRARVQPHHGRPICSRQAKWHIIGSRPDMDAVYITLPDSKPTSAHYLRPQGGERNRHVQRKKERLSFSLFLSLCRETVRYSRGRSLAERFLRTPKTFLARRDFFIKISETQDGIPVLLFLVPPSLWRWKGGDGLTRAGWRG